MLSLSGWVLRLGQEFQELTVDQVFLCPRRRAECCDNGYVPYDPSHFRSLCPRHRAGCCD
jgi:hypothetical protein